MSYALLYCDLLGFEFVFEVLLPVYSIYWAFLYPSFRLVSQWISLICIFAFFCAALSLWNTQGNTHTNSLIPLPRTELALSLEVEHFSLLILSHTSSSSGPSWIQWHYLEQHSTILVQHIITFLLCRCFHCTHCRLDGSGSHARTLSWSHALTGSGSHEQHRIGLHVCGPESFRLVLSENEVSPLWAFSYAFFKN